MLAPAAGDGSTPSVAGKHRFCEAAKLSVALAAAALPFARSADEEAERWLRILRLNGTVGTAMQALGIPEQPLIDGAARVAGDGCRAPVESVVESAACHARDRRADRVATEDLFAGVLATYGDAFERALAVRGSTAEEVAECIEAHRAAGAC